jgi:hypothetical protein
MRTRVSLDKTIPGGVLYMQALYQQINVLNRAHALQQDTESFVIARRCENSRAGLRRFTTTFRLDRLVDCSLVRGFRPDS